MSLVTAGFVSLRRVGGFFGQVARRESAGAAGLASDLEADKGALERGLGADEINLRI